MASCCVRFLILLSLLAIETTSQGNGPYFIGPRDSSACILLHDHNPSKTFVRSDTGYISAVNGKLMLQTLSCSRLTQVRYIDSWSKTCVLSPQCVFAPSNAKDVSNALTILTRSQTKFAVRSGGHMPVPGASSITDGVLISLSNLSTMIMNADNTVTIGAGLRWRDVYRYVSSYGRGICGGRFGDVGVGGLLLGGGISHFGSQYGWSANLVTEYELVLSNGRIICVSTNHYRDLFWALKGGLNNFGIVTKFTIKTFPVTEVYGGSMIFAPTSFNDFVTAVANYASPSGGMSDSLSAIEPVMAFTPSVGAAQGGTLLFRQGSDTDPASLANFTAIPHVSSDVSLRPTFAAFTDETNAPQYNDYSQRSAFQQSAASYSLRTDHYQAVILYSLPQSSVRICLSRQQYLRTISAVIPEKCQRVHNNHQPPAYLTELDRCRRAKWKRCTRSGSRGWSIYQ